MTDYIDFSECKENSGGDLISNLVRCEVTGWWHYRCITEDDQIHSVVCDHDGRCLDSWKRSSFDLIKPVVWVYCYIDEAVGILSFARQTLQSTHRYVQGDLGTMEKLDAE